MSGFIGSPTKTPAEIKRYKITYGDWLDTGETVITRTFVVSTEGTGALPTVPTSEITDAGLSVTFFIAGGDDGETYEVIVQVTTSGGQTKEDALSVAVASL